MKKMLVAIAALAWAGAAFAGDFHIGRTLRCSQCHTMHASRSHGFNTAGSAGIDAEGLLQVTPGDAHANLLIQDGTNATCLACHDYTSGAAKGPDVLGTEGAIYTPGQLANHRSAGALNGLATTGYSDWMGHTIGSTENPPGFVVGSFTADPAGFNCAQCHRVHGSDAYRNLGTGGTFFPSYNARQNYGEGSRLSTTFNGANDVTITQDARTYDTVNVSFGVGSGGMNKYCAECHGNFHDAANTVYDPLNFKRHPTSDVNRTGTGELATNAQLALVRPAWATAVGSGDFQAACLSCHKGHGNNRGYGLIYPDPAAAGAVNYEEGNAVADTAGVFPLRNLCSTCHVEGQAAGAL